MEENPKLTVYVTITEYEAECLDMLGKAIGGSIEDHVVKAVEGYLSIPVTTRESLIIFFENKPPFGQRTFNIRINAKFKPELKYDRGILANNAVSWYLRRNYPQRRIENGKEVFTMNTVSGTAPRSGLAAGADMTAAHSAPRK